MEIPAEITRRAFISLCGGATANALLTPGLAETPKPSLNFPSLPRDRIAVASYPFRQFIAGPEHKSGNPVIELKNFPAHVTKNSTFTGLSRGQHISPLRN